VLTKEVFNYKKAAYSSGNSTAAVPTAKGYYLVKSGDTLSGIAQKYRTSVSNLMRMNGLKSDKIQAGQRLKDP
jgi:LysM repeat protein